jgi:hypothetical protein
MIYEFFIASGILITSTLIFGIIVEYQNLKNPTPLKINDDNDDFDFSDNDELANWERELNMATKSKS